MVIFYEFIGEPLPQKGKVMSENLPQPVIYLPENLDAKIEITDETSLNDRFRAVTTGVLTIAGKADKRVAVVAFVVKALWPKSPNTDIWQKLTEQVQKMIDAALAKEEINNAMADLQTIYELANKISDLITTHKEISPGTLDILIGWCQQSMSQCHSFINRANNQDYSQHYLSITLSVANYHMALLKYLYDVMEMNRDKLTFAPESLLSYQEIISFLDKYEMYFTDRLLAWKKWRKSTFTHSKKGADYSYRATKDSQPTGYDYKTLTSYRGLRLHSVRSGNKAEQILNLSDEASYNNGVCDLLSAIAGAVYLTKYVPELGQEDRKNAKLVEKVKNIPETLPLGGYSSHPQGPVFYAAYRNERTYRGWGDNPEYYADKERWVTKISGQASDHKLSLVLEYRDGAQKKKTHSFKSGAKVDSLRTVEITKENPLRAITIYIKNTYICALKFDFEDGHTDTIGDAGSTDFSRKVDVPLGFALRYIETSSNSIKSQDDKGVIFNSGIKAIKFRFANPIVVS